ncbi:hypothetical protein [Archangium sp.]|uniref:hypothetical protein n=1 Tax=Archangium sp. TaxID=1872627 RepID=UPI002D514E8F|nr:hypothetical protein [Archangium sp.]HYO52366.1 hypothetical protein [Archangium sp.]
MSEPTTQPEVPNPPPVSSATPPPPLESSGPKPSEAVTNLFNLLRRPSTERVDTAEATQALYLALRSLEEAHQAGAPKGSSPAEQLIHLLRALDEFQSTRESSEDASRRRQENHRKQRAWQRFVLLLVSSFLSALFIAGGTFLATRSTPGLWHGAWLIGSASMILTLFLVTRELYPAEPNKQGE